MSRKNAKKRARAGAATVAPVAQPPTPPAPSPDTVEVSGAPAGVAAPAAVHAPAVVDAPAVVAAPAAVAAPAPVAAPSDDVAASDDIAAQFFSAPPVTHPDEPVAVEAPIDRPARLRAPHGAAAAARRRDLTRYVTGAVAVCFMICVAAAVRAATAHAGPNPTAPSYQTSAAAPRTEEPRQPAEPPAAPAEPAQPPAPVIAPQREPATAPPEARAETVVAEPPPPAPEPAASAVDTTPADPAAALAAKRDAQRAIDRGDMAHAIEASQRSVDLDRTDAEAWLILGAAYLQKGAYREAHEAFATCTHDATRGPRGECRALLR